MVQNGAGAFLISWKVLSLDFSGNVFFSEYYLGYRFAKAT